MLAMIPKPRPNWIPIITSLLFLMGCSSAYYGTMEKLGYHKRDLMVSRVEAARDAQQGHVALDLFAQQLTAANWKKSMNS